MPIGESHQEREWGVIQHINILKEDVASLDRFGVTDRQERGEWERKLETYKSGLFDTLYQRGLDAILKRERKPNLSLPGLRLVLPTGNWR